MRTMCTINMTLHKTVLSSAVEARRRQRLLQRRMGDRSGGRESKGTSLKKSKKNPGASAARVKTVAKAPNSGPAVSEVAPAPGDELYFDCGVALLSRQFDRDRERVITRAKQDGGCCGMMIWFADIEKQTAIADHCKTFSGACYFSTGVHPDNIDRTNKKSHEDWLQKVEELAKRAECVSILSGLNLTREIGTHFAQEALLKSSAQLAIKLHQPLVLHISNGASLLRAIEILRSEGCLADSSEDTEDSTLQMLLHDAMTCCESKVELFQAAIDAGFYFLIAATGLTDSGEEFVEVRARAQACIRAIPTDKLLLCTDSPWKTPQNLPDVYLRTLRNEPSNIASIAVSVSEALGVEVQELSATIRSNTLAVLGLAGDTGLTKGIKDLSILAGDAIKPTSGAKDPTATPPAAHAKKIAKAGAGASTKTPQTKAYYSCVRCRCRLFSGADVKTHALGSTVKTVFKVGEEGLCASTVLFKHDPEEAHNNAHPNKAISIKGNNVECVECGNKLGKFSSTEAHCGCGAVVPGPVIKVISSKVDYSDGTATETHQQLQELAQRAQVENEDLHLQEAVREQETSAIGNTSKRDKKKKLKSENKGNFSSYRNKSFIPGASRTGGSATAKVKNNLELLQEMIGGGESSGEGSGSEDGEEGN